MNSKIRRNKYPSQGFHIGERVKDVLDSKTKVEVKKLAIRIAVDEIVLSTMAEMLLIRCFVERNKIIHLNLSARNALTAYSFLKF